MPVIVCVVTIVGCGKDTKSEGAKPATKKVEEKRPMKTVKKVPPARRKVSDKEAAKLLLAQMREWMELSGLPKSRVDSKMFELEMDVSKSYMS